MFHVKTSVYASNFVCVWFCVCKVFLFEKITFLFRRQLALALSSRSVFFGLEVRACMFEIIIIAWLFFSIELIQIISIHVVGGRKKFVEALKLR